MYHYSSPNQLIFKDFLLPFGGQLRSDNCWEILSKQIPWDQYEQAYATNFSSDNSGSNAKSVRIAFGALIIKERLGLTDRETVLQIAENSYLQYFLGFLSFKDEVPFDHSLMTHFRKRFNQKSLSEINELIVKNAINEMESASACEAQSTSEKEDKEEEKKDPPN